MRWFFALNEASTSFWEYANLVQVAVHSAQTRTTLTPVCLYDGDDNTLTAWLKSAGVTIIRRRTFLHRWVADLAPIPRGAYLRLEIPAVCAEQGWTDEFVLYTDCDVVFRDDPTASLTPLRPEFFAAAPESDQTDFIHFNSGVMWINVGGLAAEQAALHATIQAHLAEAIAPPYDQAVLQRHFANRSAPLPLELNWKPHWGPNPQAIILHFHGPKPAQKYHVLNHRAPDYVQRLVGADYFAASAEWDNLLIDALATHPWSTTSVSRMADGFDSIATVTHGLGDPEGPNPEIMAPQVRWGLSPETELTFDQGSSDSLRFEAAFQSSTPGQALSVCLNQREIAHVALTRLADNYHLSLDLPPATGPQQIKIHYALGVRPNNADPRALGVLFSTLRVRRV
jgi:hypothetical protein